ncbi:serine hydrolase domain-containing protein [Deminuibacter soli]|nr:serine hydrolase domain-containing protein [Deminuibacter soli]
MKTITALLAILLLLEYAGAHAAPFTDTTLIADNRQQTRLDSLVQTAASAYMQHPHANSLSIGIVQNGHVYFYNYHKGAGALPTSESVYGIGSVAKVFLCSMAARAVVASRLQLNEDIRKYLPGKYPNLVYRQQPVRVVHLANHTSAMPGMSRTYADAYLDSVLKLDPQRFGDWYRAYTADSLIKDMHHFVLDTVPGTKLRYNGNGMMVLMAIMEKVYHQPYETLLTQFLRDSLNMHDSRLTLYAAQQDRVVQGYDENGKALPFIVDKGFRAAPSLLSTAADMVKFIQWNLNEHNSAVQLAHTTTFKDADTELGLGWFKGIDAQQHHYLLHSGHEGTGFNSICVLYPANNTGIVILVNEITGQDRVNDLKDKLAEGLME